MHLVVPVLRGEVLGVVNRPGQGVWGVIYTSHRVVAHGEYLASVIGVQG